MTPQRSRPANDYQIAWICALPIETVAAIGMLDEEHPLLRQRVDDPNSYTLGRIGLHNVVIASPPPGNFRNASRGRMITGIIGTFPSVGLLLSVGIGGGAPSENYDVRLGDVVVGVPVGPHPAVIQYDLRRSGIDSVHRFAPQNAPHHILSAVRKLQSRYQVEESAVSDYLSDMLIRSARPKTVFTRPDDRLDQLFEATYEHIDGPDCSSCDPSRVLERPVRHSKGPFIHYGPIASSDLVMKSARLRDKLQQELGVLCYEMEAGGLIENAPCLVIRGVCDYADSHKTRAWQGYAAAVAAAYTKELLSVVPRSYTTEPWWAGQMSWETLARDYSARDSLFKLRDRAFLVPFARNPQFSNREEVTAEINKLLSQQHQCIFLHGLDGTGKTQIGLEFAYRTRERDPETHILWLDASSADRFVQACQSLCKALPVNIGKDSDPNPCQAIFTWLRRHDERWLLIIDDIESWMLDSPVLIEIKALARELSAASASDDILMLTARKPSFASAMGIKNSIDVSVLSSAEATKLLYSVLRDEDGDSNVGDLSSALVEFLGCSPLAIVSAAEYLNRSSISIGQYLEILRGYQHNTTTSGSKIADLAVTSQISPTLGLTFQMLRKSDPDAAHLLSTLVMFESRRIPEYLLRAPETSDLRHRSEVDSLVAMSLLADEVDKKSFAIHVLLQNTVLGLLRESEQEEFYANEALRLLAERFPDPRAQTKETCKSLIPLCMPVLQHNLQSKSALVNRAALLFKVGSFELENGQFEPAHSKVLEACNIYEKELGRDDEKTFMAMETLARITFSQQSYSEATALYEAMIEIKKQALGYDNSEISRLKNSLALCFAQQGRLSESESLLREVLDESQRMFGDEHPETLSARSSLGTVLLSEGQYTDAEALFRRTYDQCQVAFGSSHPDTLASMNNLVLALSRQSKNEEAEQLAKETLRISLMVLGDAHPDTLASMNNLALTLGNMGQYEAAEEINKRALHLYEQVLGSDHPSRLTSLHNLAELYMLQGKLEDSAALYEELTIAEQALTEDDAIINSSRCCLAQVLEAQGRFEEAAAHLEKVCESNVRVLGKDHSTTVEWMEHHREVLETIEEQNLEKHGSET